MRTVLIICALLLIGCSTERRCARAAKRCAPVWEKQKPDTLFIDRIVTIDSSRVDTVIDCDELPVDSTITIQEDSTKAKITLRKQKGGKLKIDCDCPEQEVLVKDKVITKPPIVVEKLPPWVPLGLLLNVFAGLALGFFFSGRNRKQS